MTLRVAGDRRALALAGAEAAGSAPGPTVHLGEPSLPAEPGDVVWLPHPAGSAPGGARLIATGGDGLWSRAPWPAADALFDLPPPAAPHALVVSDDAERRALVVDALTVRGRSAAAAAALTVEDLAAAAVVALLGAADAPAPASPWTATTMPAEAPAVLAARRVLIAPRCETTFGLLPGTDHLAFSTHDDVVHYADAALTFPESFEPFRVLGAIAAERHRASRVYARLAAELT